MTKVVETVPNFSEGRDPEFVGAAAAAFTTAGCEVLHTTMDPDHHRSVITAIGSPAAVVDGAVAAAALALERIDMRRHRGVHPRIGALDVLPFVPLHGMDMPAAAALARRAAARIARLGIPVYLYGAASKPQGRGLASIRRGGFEALAASPRRGRAAADLHGRGAGPATEPTADAHGHRFAHPTAGATCVGAREVLLAWNVDIEGVGLAAARGIAAGIREAGGGFAGLRALALLLHEQNRLQIAMNLEDPAATDPLVVFRTIERRVRALGGRVAGTEVIGMLPDQVPPGTGRRMRGRDWSEDRLLHRRVQSYLAACSPAGAGLEA
ncbi:MAG: glutamate formiminotransferase [Gemmatimonadetes bacterium]|nr:glutamate formiminotransferase [Gemmatimonadota bacterium]MYE94893.1 glutamate formiminotransferase [Gemmatimonadota bacterium]MYJ11765.1 glutamate formiminotransferase [Gemmatimonadota bacterium]